MNYPRAFRKLRKEWGGHCVECGTNRRLQFAHLPGKPTGLNGRGRGMPQRYHDIKKHPDCYVLLCRTCHKRLDERTWDYSDRVEEQPE